MSEPFDPRDSDAFVDTAPTWLRALQAAVIGLVAGLVLHAILAMVVLQAGTPDAAPKECRKAHPSREVVSPPLNPPTGPAVRWVTPAL